MTNSEVAIVADTSSLIAYFAGNGPQDSLIKKALEEDRLFVPPIAVAELLSGSSSEARESELFTFFDSSILLSPNNTHWIAVGRLRRTLGRNGVNLTIPDAHVLQCAIDADGVLISYDKVFKSAVRYLNVRLA